MPDLERWELKAMKRINRFENTDEERIRNKIYNGARAFGNFLTKGILGYARSYIGGLFKPKESQIINGKAFNEKTSIMRPVIQKVGANVAEKATDVAGNAADSFFTRDFFYPSGKDVAETAFYGRVVFDNERIRQMSNTCGYEPDFPKILDSLYDTAVKVEPVLTDITWRKEVTPHMIRTAYQEELEKTFGAILDLHRKNPNLYNRQVVESHLNIAARKLADVFEKFTLDLANYTDYLEAPMTFLPKKPVSHNDVEMTKDEKNLLSKVSRQSLFASESDLQKKISQATKMLPKLTTQETVKRFKNNLDQHVIAADGSVTAYKNGVDPVEDSRRLTISILNLREMMQRYENRNFFNRFFSQDGRQERAAINEMEAYLQEKLGMGAKQLSNLLDLKTPLESNIALSELMNIPQREPERKPESKPEIKEKTSVEPAQKSTAPVPTVTEQIASAANAIYQGDVGFGDVFNSDVNFFDDLDDMDEILGGHSQPVQTTEVQPAAVPEEKKPEVSTESEPQNQGSFMNTVWNSAATVASYLNPFSYFGTQKTEEVKPAEPIPEEAPAEIEEKQEPVPEKIESAPEAKAQPSLLEQIQAKEAAVINELRDSKDLAKIFILSLAKLMYFKTLEVSVTSKSIDATQLEASLSEENVNAGARKIHFQDAFRKLEILESKGFAKRAREFATNCDSNPSFVSDLHKKYMNNLQNPTALNAPKEKASAAANTAERKGPENSGKQL